MEGAGYKKLFQLQGIATANQESRDSSQMWLKHSLRWGSGEQSRQENLTSIRHAQDFVFSA